MADTIDFESAARRIVELTDLRLVQEQLQLVWNARGAADVAKLETELVRLAIPTRHVGPLTRALGDLDR